MMFLFLACNIQATTSPNNSTNEQLSSPEYTDETAEAIDEGSDTDSELETATETESDTESSIETQTEEETLTEEETDTVTDEVLLADLTDFSLTGSYSVVSRTESAAVTDCADMTYHVYTPQNVANPPTMVLAHGFARGGSKVVSWAEHFASWGVEILVPMDLCHYNVFSVDHEMNGQNMMELAALHGVQAPIYGGHSAGGLAAVIAASMDSNTRGLIGLDATDTEGVPSVPDFVGQPYAPAVTAPTFGLVAEPSSCNSNNNGITLMGLIQGSTLLRIRDSDHCDFEFPTDGACELFCNNDATFFDDTEIRPMIVQLATAALMTLTGLQSDGEMYWSGSTLDELLADGLVQEL